MFGRSIAEVSNSEGKVERLSGVLCIALSHYLFVDKDPKVIFVILTPSIMAKWSLRFFDASLFNTILLSLYHNQTK